MEEVCPPKILTEQTNMIFSHFPKTLSLVKLYTCENKEHARVP